MWLSRGKESAIKTMSVRPSVCLSVRPSDNLSKSYPILLNFFLNAWNLICSKFEDGHNRIFGSKVMGKKVLKMAVFRHFLQFFPNISKNMIDRESLSQPVL